MKNNIIESFKQMYGKEAEGYAQSGGRFELLGNHTDHNHGKTLAATCSLIIEGAFAKEEDNVVRFFSKGNCARLLSVRSEKTQHLVERLALFIFDINAVTNPRIVSGSSSFSSLQILDK